MLPHHLPFFRTVCFLALRLSAFLPGERPGTVGIPSWKSSIFILGLERQGQTSLVLTWEAGPAPIAALSTIRGVLPVRPEDGGWGWGPAGLWAGASVHMSISARVCATWSWSGPQGS